MGPDDIVGKILWYYNTISTNSLAREGLEGIANMSMIAAKCQSAGRGQGDHSWYASPGLNITASAVFKFENLPAAESSAISCAVALAVRDYLLDEGIEAAIKWPNDIWVGGKKICGLLIENIVQGQKTIASIAGIGLNINEMDWPEELPNPISLKELTGKEYKVEDELVRLHAKICRRIAMTASPDGRLSLQEEFGKYMFRLA